LRAWLTRPEGKNVQIYVLASQSHCVDPGQTKNLLCERLWKK